MAHRKPFLNFCCGSKHRGVIFTLDSVIAVFIVSTILILSVFFIARSEEQSITDIQISRLGNDIFAILDYTGVLRDFDITKIRNEINSFLPDAYSMGYKIDCETRKYDSRINLNVSQPVFSGERIFIDSKFNNCVVRYWIWTD